MATRARLLERRQPWGDPGRGVAAGTRPWLLYGAEAAPATALGQVLRRRGADDRDEDRPRPHDDDVPLRSFLNDLDRKVALRRVMGRPKGDDDDEERREQDERGPAEQFSKEDVNYRYSGQPDHACGVCRYFVEPGACEIVAGLIRPVDVCDKFEPRGEGGGGRVRARLAEQGGVVGDDVRRAIVEPPNEPSPNGRLSPYGSPVPIPPWSIEPPPEGAAWADFDVAEGGLVEFDPGQARDPAGKFAGTAFRVTPPKGAQRAPGVVAVGEPPAEPEAPGRRRHGLRTRLRAMRRALRPGPPPEMVDSEQGLPAYPTSGGVNLGALGPAVRSLAVPTGGMRAEEGRMRTVRARLVEVHRRRPCREAACFRRHIEVTPPGFEPVVKALKRRPGVRSPWAVAWAMKKAGVVPGGAEGEAGARPHTVTFSRHSGAAEVSPPGWEGVVKHMKDHPEITSPHALARWMKGQGFQPRRGPRGGRPQAVMAEAVR